MPLPNLNTVSLVTYLDGLSSSDWSTFSSDMNSNFVNAWASRFTLSTRAANALALCPSAMKTNFINSASYASTMISSMLLDARGSAFDTDPGGGATSLWPHFEVHTDWIVVNTGAIPVLVCASIWWDIRF